MCFMMKSFFTTNITVPASKKIHSYFLQMCSDFYTLLTRIMDKFWHHWRSFACVIH